MINGFRKAKIVNEVVILFKEMHSNGRLKDAQKIFWDLIIKGYHLDVMIYIVMVRGLL